MRVIAFIQARMGSTRLPGKTLKKVLGRPLLSFLLERISQSKELNDFVVLTTEEPEDDEIALFCEKQDVLCFRGSKEDVLDRFYQAANKWQPDAIVRITADCPLVDPDIVDEVIRAFCSEFPNLDYVSNSIERTFPRGLDVEIFSFQALKKAYFASILLEEREHVTPYFYRHPDQFRLKNIVCTSNLSQYRWTVDTEEDFTLVQLILENLYPSIPQFRMKDILRLLTEHPSWNEINRNIQQKKL